MSGNTDSENKDAAIPTSTPTRRRSSLVELFAARPNLESASIGRSDTARAASSSMASALSQAQQQSKARRLSITTLGLSGSPTRGHQTSPFGTLRRGSSSSEAVRTNSEETEHAIDDTDISSPPRTGSAGVEEGNARGRGSGAMSPIGRRFSFGARAYGDARANGGGGSNEKTPAGGGAGVGITSAASPTNGSASSKGSSPPGLKGKEGFSWTETLRTRAERSSISAGVSGATVPLASMHNRSRSTTTSEQPVPAPIPKPVPTAPDHFQERILKGDFYMD